MDILRHEAWDDFFLRRRFLERPVSHSPMDLSLVTIRQFESETTFDQTKISEKDIAKYMREPVEQHENKKAAASLRLVRIDYTSNPNELLLVMKQRNFVNLFKTLNTDVYCLQLLLDAPYGGVHQFKLLLDQGQGCIISVYVRTPEYTMIWSYTSTDFTTKAIIIPHPLYPFDGTFVELTSALNRYRSLVDSPHYLLFICGIGMARWLSSTVNFERERVNRIEEGTGYATWLKGDSRQEKRDTHKLAELSTRAGQCLKRSAGVVRNSSTVKKIFQELISASKKTSKFPQSSPQRIAEVAMVFLDRIVLIELDNSEIAERARIQQTVIYNLINREDTLLNTQIAIAAKNDSSAMKTIAIMTMAFLPATFFAALFAIPSLQWQNDSVISHRFWVYWAFTLPSTAMVFVIWWVFGYKEPAGGIGSVAKKREGSSELGENFSEESLRSNVKTPSVYGSPWHRPKSRQGRKRLPSHEHEMVNMSSRPSVAE